MIEKSANDCQRKAATEPPSMSIALPLMIAAADDDRDKLQEIWARLLERELDRHPALAFCLSMIPRVKPEGMLFGKPVSTFPDHALAGAADTSCAKSFRARFIEVAKRLDPLDAPVLEKSQNRSGVSGQIRNDIAAELKARTDEVGISLENLTRLQLVTNPGSASFVSALGGNFCGRFLIDDNARRAVARVT